MIVNVGAICMSTDHDLIIICKASLDKFTAQLVRLFGRYFSRLKGLDKMKPLYLVCFFEMPFRFEHLRICDFTRAIKTRS